MMKEVCDELGVTESTPRTFDTIHDDLLFDGALHLVFGEQQTGKTYFVLKVITDMLKELGNDAPEVWYFDGDLVGVTMKVFSNYLKNNDRFHYREVNDSEFLTKMCNRVAKYKNTDEDDSNLLKPVLIFDSLKDFMCGGSVDSNGDVMKWWDYMKILRDRCSAIIIICHSRVGYTSDGTTFTKMQGNEAALTQTPHMIFEVTHYGVSVYKSKCGDHKKGDIVLKRDDMILPFNKYFGRTKNEMFTALGYYKDEAIKKKILEAENSIWKIEKEGRKLIVTAVH